MLSPSQNFSIGFAMTQDFLNRMNGRFHGLLQWRDLDALWNRVRAEPEGWYVSLIGIEPAQQTMTSAAQRCTPSSPRWTSCCGANTLSTIAASCMRTIPSAPN